LAHDATSCRQPAGAGSGTDPRDTRSSLFSDALGSYFWSYDNAGLRLAQLRFYQIPPTAVGTTP